MIGLVDILSVTGKIFWKMEFNHSLKGKLWEGEEDKEKESEREREKRGEKS